MGRKQKPKQKPKNLGEKNFRKKILFECIFSYGWVLVAYLKKEE